MILKRKTRRCLSRPETNMLDLLTLSMTLVATLASLPRTSESRGAQKVTWKMLRSNWLSMSSFLQSWSPRYGRCAVSMALSEVW